MIIIVISFFGEMMNKMIPLPVPASVWGIAILFTLLATKEIELNQIEDASSFMLGIIGICFVVPAVGLWEVILQYKSQFALIFLIVIASTFITMVITGVFAQAMIKAALKRKARPAPRKGKAVRK